MARIRAGKPRHTQAAREKVIATFTHQRDAIGTLITIIFDGAGPSIGPGRSPSTPERVLRCFKSGRTADDSIERGIHWLVPFCDIVVGTEDFAERDTMISLRGSTVRCNQSIGQLGYIPIELQRVIEWVNDEFLGVPVREALLVALPG